MAFETVHFHAFGLELIGGNPFMITVMPIIPQLWLYGLQGVRAKFRERNFGRFKVLLGVPIVGAVLSPLWVTLTQSGDPFFYTGSSGMAAYRAFFAYHLCSLFAYAWVYLIAPQLAARTTIAPAPKPQLDVGEVGGDVAFLYSLRDVQAEGGVWTRAGTTFSWSEDAGFALCVELGVQGSLNTVLGLAELQTVQVSRLLAEVPKSWLQTLVRRVSPPAHYVHARFRSRRGKEIEIMAPADPASLEGLREYEGRGIIVQLEVLQDCIALAYSSDAKVQS